MKIKNPTMSFYIDWFGRASQRLQGRGAQADDERWLRAGFAPDYCQSEEPESSGKTRCVYKTWSHLFQRRSCFNWTWQRFRLVYIFMVYYFVLLDLYILRIIFCVQFNTFIIISLFHFYFLHHRSEGYALNYFSI